MRVCVERLSQNVRFYAYFFLESQANNRLRTTGYKGSVIDAQRPYTTSFKDLIIRPTDTGKKTGITTSKAC